MDSNLIMTSNLEVKLQLNRYSKFSYLVFFCLTFLEVRSFMESPSFISKNFGFLTSVSSASTTIFFWENKKYHMSASHVRPLPVGICLNLVCGKSIKFYNAGIPRLRSVLYHIIKKGYHSRIEETRLITKHLPLPHSLLWWCDVLHRWCVNKFSED